MGFPVTDPTEYTRGDMTLLVSSHKVGNKNLSRLLNTKFVSINYFFLLLKLFGLTLMKDWEEVT